MLLTFLVAGVAGWAARLAEPRVTEALRGILGDEALQDAADRRVGAVLVALMGGGVLLALLDADDNALVFGLGAAVGYFFDALRTRFGRKD